MLHRLIIILLECCNFCNESIKLWRRVVMEDVGKLMMYNTGEKLTRQKWEAENMQNNISGSE